MTDSDVQELFRARAQAVRDQDIDLFLSTQISELEFASSDGYLALRDLQLDILYVHEESDIERVVLVKETYARPQKGDRSSILLYFLTRTTRGWRIYRVR